MLCGKLPYAALSLTPRNLDDIPPIADSSSGPGAARAALRAQGEHESKVKQEAKALVRNYSNRIAFVLATATRPKARLKSVQTTRCTAAISLIYDGVQMYNEMKDELANLYNAYDADVNGSGAKRG
eukprot:2173119-Pleurochrysis_carterae.AAC.2